MLAVDGGGQGDDDAADAGVDGAEGVFYLGQHAAADGAVGTVAVVVGAADDGYDAGVVVRAEEHAGLLKGEDEGDVVACGQGLGGLGGHGVGVGVEDVAVAVVCQGGYDGHQAGLDEG